MHGTKLFFSINQFGDRFDYFKDVILFVYFGQIFRSPSALYIMSISNFTSNSTYFITTRKRGVVSDERDS